MIMNRGGVVVGRNELVSSCGVQFGHKVRNLLLKRLRVLHHEFILRENHVAQLLVIVHNVHHEFRSDDIAPALVVPQPV